MLKYYPIELLHYAGMSDESLNQVKEIINLFPDYLNQTNSLHDTALIISIRTGNTKIAQFLLEQPYINIDKICNQEGNAFFVANIYDRKEIIFTLLMEKNIIIDNETKKWLNGQNKYNKTYNYSLELLKTREIYEKLNKNINQSNKKNKINKI